MANACGQVMLFSIPSALNACSILSVSMVTLSGILPDSVYEKTYFRKAPLFLTHLDACRHAQPARHSPERKCVISIVCIKIFGRKRITTHGNASLSPTGTCDAGERIH